MDFSALGKRGKMVARATREPGQLLTGVIKVRSAGYVPSKARLRAQIAPAMLTADFLSDDLDAIEQDPEVESVAVSEKLPLQRLP